MYTPASSSSAANIVNIPLRNSNINNEMEHFHGQSKGVVGCPPPSPYISYIVFYPNAKFSLI